MGKKNDTSKVSPLRVIQAIAGELVHFARDDADYKRRCHAALGEFQRRTGLRLWLRYAREDDIVHCRINRTTGKVIDVTHVERGFPGGCVVAFCDPVDERLYIGNSRCTSADRKRFSRNVGRWAALFNAQPVVPWELSTSLRDSKSLADTLAMRGNELVLTDFHHWLCRNKVMVLDAASYCINQFIDTAPTISDLAIADADEAAKLYISRLETELASAKLASVELASA